MRATPSIAEPFRFAGDLWNVFVPTCAPQYDELSELIKKATPRECCARPDGVWVPYGWLLPGRNGGFRRIKNRPSTAG
jgi:hypothetical protein